MHGLYVVAVWIGRAMLAALVSICSIGAALYVGSHHNAAWGAEAIPPLAQRSQRTLIQISQAHCGLDCPVSLFAGQVHQESGWRPEAVSRAGAQGAAQVMPATATWLGRTFPALAQVAPYDIGWSLRALVIYDAWLYRRVEADTECDRWWMALWGYNGGEGWRLRDQAAARAAGANPGRAAEVEPYNAGRSPANHAENRGYPRRIATLQTRYVQSGFGPGIATGKGRCQ